MSKTIVAFGDSITRGTYGGIPEERTWLEVLRGMLGKGFDLVNAGVNGNSSRETMARFETDVLAHEPDIVIIEFGGNNNDPYNPERRVPDSEFEEHLQKFRESLPEKCKVIVCTFPPITDELHPSYGHPYFQGRSLDGLLEPHREITRKFARENGYVLLDLYHVIDEDRNKFIQGDGVHLSEAGQEVFAAAAKNALMQVEGMETYMLALSEMEKYGLDADLRIDPILPSFEIRSVEGRIVISAPSDIELLYGVYDLAERIGGYYFFEPGRDRFEPARKTIPPANCIIAPAKRPKLSVRGLVQEFPFSEEETPILLDWMAKNKLNYMETWMKFYDGCRDEWKEMARIRGIEIESGHHNFNYWIPGRKYNESHPEFFAEINGSRIVSNDGKCQLLLSEQLCTTNVELREEIVKNMLAYCEAHPEIRTVAIHPNDGFGWCECSECSKFYDVNRKGDFYSVSEHVYKADRIYHDLVRYLGRRLHAARPDITLSFGAYINYCAPSEGFTLDEGMAVSMAPYWRCINHEINDRDCPINSHYADDIMAWAACSRGGQLRIYEYYMGINFYLSLPMIHFTEMFHEIDWYEGVGVNGLMTQFHITHWTVYGMNFVLMARAARGELYDEAVPLLFKVLFGRDSAAAAEFYASVKRLVKEAGRCHIPYPLSLLSRTRLEDYMELNEKAAGLAALAPDDAFRKEIVIWTEYMVRFKRLFDDYKSGLVEERHLDEFLAWIASHEGTRVFVQSKFPMYFEALRTALREGTEWLHFNIGWEDEYVRRHMDFLG